MNFNLSGVLLLLTLQAGSAIAGTAGQNLPAPYTAIQSCISELEEDSSSNVFDGVLIPRFEAIVVQQTSVSLWTMVHIFEKNVAEQPVEGVVVLSHQLEINCIVDQIGAVVSLKYDEVSESGKLQRMKASLQDRDFAKEYFRTLSEEVDSGKSVALERTTFHANLGVITNTGYEVVVLNSDNFRR